MRKTIAINRSQSSEQAREEQSQAEQEKRSAYDRLHACLNAAIRYLSYRARSEHEVRQRLQRRGFDSKSVAAVIAQLKEQGLIDDTAFAESWREDRNAFNPRSQRLLKLELKHKGIASGITDQVTGTMDDKDSAYRAAVNKARSLPRSDYECFCRRLGEYLRRRGFDYRVINNAVEQAWQELSRQSEHTLLERRTPDV